MTTGPDPKDIPLWCTTLAATEWDLTSMTATTMLQQRSMCSVVKGVRKESTQAPTPQEQGKPLEDVSMSRIGATLIGSTVLLQSGTGFQSAA